MVAKHKPAEPMRKRNPTDTRARILSAARQRFSVDIYEHVGVRDIAADASVDPALVNRYFGSKEKLFKEVITGVFCLDRYLPDAIKLKDLGAHLANTLMSQGDCCKWNDGCDSLQLLLRSAASPTASAVISASFHAEFVAPLAKLLSGSSANLRAAMICAYAIGLGTMRVALQSPAIKPSDTRKMTAMFVKAIQDCIAADDLGR